MGERQREKMRKIARDVGHMHVSMSESRCLCKSVREEEKETEG